MSNNNASKGSLATPSISDSPIVADSQATNEKWLAQQLSESGITNPVLVKQFKPHKAGFTVTGVDITGKTNSNSWQLRLREVGKDGAKYKTRRRKEGETGCIYDALLLRGRLKDFISLAGKLKPLFASEEQWNNCLTKDLWKVVNSQDHLPIVITEGGKKAACGLENGYLTISIPGREMWHKPQTLELVTSLADFCSEGRPVYIALDSDFQINPDVKESIRRLAKALDERGCDVKICVWKYTKKTKGMDDFIVNGGNFDEVIRLALTIAEWEKQFPEPEQKKESPAKKGKSEEEGNGDPTPVEFARQLAEEYRNKWRFHNEWKVWLEWSGKYWQIIPEEKVGDAIHFLSESWISTDRYVTMCQKSLTRNLREWEWQRQTLEATAFRNGVVNLREMTIKPHDPENYNTSMIDRDWWQPEGEVIADPIEALKTYCPNIYEAWNYAMVGDERKILKLMAVCNGVITWRLSKLHKFIHLTGRPGTGKGTFSRILSALIGEENTKASKLGKLGEDYQLAHFMDSQLVVLPDEEATHCDSAMANLKSLTGGDTVSYRQIYGEVASSPFHGTLLVISNGALFKKPQKALERRLCLVEFDSPIVNRTPLAEELMMREISQLTYCVLSMPPQRVDDLIKGVGQFAIADFKAKEWELLCEESSVAAFVEDKVVPVPGDGVIKQGELYHKYVIYCEENGLKPMATNRFGNKLTEMCEFLGWEVKSVKKMSGKTFFGIDYRGDCSHVNVPLPSETLLSDEKSSTVVSSSSSSYSHNHDGQIDHISRI